MTHPRSRWRLALLAVTLVAAACSQPIEIVGEGDVISATGDHDCTYVDFTAGSPSCTANLITGDYIETYTGVPAAGWHFHRWVNYCANATGDTCSFAVPASIVDQALGVTVPPLVAIFRPDVVTGFETLFIGHSFFIPIASEMDFHASTAGFTDHAQQTVFSGGASGAPEALWNNATKRGQIQAILDTGEIELLGMTYHPDYPSLTGYRNWVGYALAANPDTRFFIGLPWLPNPGSFSAATYGATWQAAHDALAHQMLDDLRDEFPGVDFYGIPYGQAAGELYELYDAGQLPDVDALVGGGGDEGIFRDSFGHADDILLDLAELVWLRAIYGVDLSTYAHDPGYTTDIKAIADAIMDEHDPAYDAP